MELKITRLPSKHIHTAIHRPIPNHRLPKPNLDQKAQDNRDKANRLRNEQLGLLPVPRSRHVTDDSVLQDFDLSSINELAPPQLPSISQPRRVSPELYADIKKLSPETQAQLKTIPTKYSKTPHQAVSNLIGRIPMGLALNANSISVYASYLLTFFSWYEYSQGVKITRNTRFTPYIIYTFAKSLILCEYNDPLIYYNCVVKAMSQTTTADGRRTLESDFLTQLDITQHRESLDNYRRKYAPDQAALLSPSLLLNGHVSLENGALLLLWLYGALRLSSIDGMTAPQPKLYGSTTVGLTFSVLHFKGSLANTETVTIYCNCVDPHLNPLELCPLHSTAYSYKRISFPVSRAAAEAAIAEAGVQSHSPRVTLAAIIYRARANHPELKENLHQDHINSRFYWKGSQQTMFAYYSRNHQNLTDGWPINSITRAATFEAFSPEGQPLKNKKKCASALPGNYIEVIQASDTTF